MCVYLGSYLSFNGGRILTNRTGIEGPIPPVLPHEIPAVLGTLARSDISLLWVTEAFVSESGAVCKQNLRGPLVPIGINNMTYFIATFHSVKQHNCVLRSTLYATQDSLFIHTHLQREKQVGGYRSKIYVTVLSGRPCQGYFDGWPRAAQRSNCRACFAPATDRQQVAQAIL